MRWQRVARLGFGVAGIGCLAALAMQFHTRKAPTPEPVPTKHDPAATVEGGHGETIEWKNGDEGWHIEFASMAGYPDNHNKFTQAHFSSAHSSHPFDLWADSAETQGKGARAAGPADMHLKGHVRVTTSDHWLILTESATYSDATGLLTMPGPLTFARDRLSGEGQSATYDRFNGVLQILNRAHVVAQADTTGEGALDATATRMTMTRPAKSAHLEGATRVERDKEILSADVQSVLFTDDEKGLKQLDMRGHASVTPKPGATDAPPDMHADTIGLWLYPDGRTLQHATLRGQANVQLTSTTGAKTIAAPSVDLQLAKDGQTVTGLDGHAGVTVHLPPTADTPSARTIKAPTLVSTGDEKEGLKTALFTGGVTFQEQVPASGTTAASTRTANSKALSLKLNGDLGAVEEADFRDAVQFQDADVMAKADHATYNEAKNLLILDTPPGRAQPEVINGTVTVHGDLVHLATDTHDVEATGTVRTKSTPSKPADGTKPPSPGLFDADQPVLGASVRLVYENAAQRATYHGKDTERAQIWQNANQNEVHGDVVVVEQATNDLHATGHVTSVFAADPKPATPAPAGRAASAPAPGPPTIYRGSAQELVYTDAKRTAHYVGSTEAAELKGPDGTTTARLIDVVLAQESRSVDRLEADGTVHLTSETKREGRGDHLTYEATADQYHLTGTPAVAVLPQSKASPSQTQQCTQYSAKDLTFAGNGFAAASSGGDNVTSMDWPCGKPIPGPVK
jgi:lipopolysaccharide export system protein LptA